ncbi:hypothetical protein [Halomonas faecis]|uniref:hypothetical protein n=1 Tax=Halomonas faecis TaxID=1562110 RepID=UPI0013D5E647|nr:hypothetical protein [Halomonas faecis]
MSNDATPFGSVAAAADHPTNEHRGYTYSFRAECDYDTQQFLRAIDLSGFTITGLVIDPIDGLPDVQMQITTDASLEQLRDILRSITDSHVMLQTLRQAPLAGNSLKRDYELE